MRLSEEARALRDHAIAQHDTPDTNLAPELETLVDGLRVCPHPSTYHTALRILPRAAIPEDARAAFAAPPDAPGYAAVFFDPQALTLRNFENILPLDDHFHRAKCQLLGHEVHGDGVIHTMRLRGLSKRLTELDEAGLYVTPPNHAQRGGRRLIFHAAPLARALTNALRRALPEDMLQGFVSVNPVFRMSRFQPSDAPFARHLDAPYCDTSRSHISRHTLLIYLTGGAGTPALDVAGVALPTLDAMTCVLFEQHHPHEGQPYLAGDKVFVRTELLFEAPEMTQDPEVGRAFARATYLSGAVTQDPALATHEHDAYDRVARAHWEGRLERRKEEVFLLRRFQGADYIANGYDFWFHGVTLSEAATLAIFDHFNCELGGRPYRRLCETQTLQRPRTMDAWIPETLRRVHRIDTDSISAQLPKQWLFPLPEPAEPGNVLPDTISEYQGRGDYDDPTRNAQVLALYERAQDEARGAIELAPIMMLGHELFLDESRFVVEGDKLHILSKTRVAPLHFAAMYYEEVSPPSFVETQYDFQTLHPLIPPILWRWVDGCWHLRLDFFRNTWMVEVASEPGRVPCITTR